MMSRKQKYRRAKRMIYRIITLLFAAVVFGFSAGNLIKKDREYSETENRMLEQKPSVSISGIADGSYMEKYETYQADQFAGRDTWMEIKTGMELLLGKRESNGVFLGEDGVLMEELSDDSGKNVAENLEEINNFAARNEGINFYFLLAPNAAQVWKEKLPAFAVTEDQEKQFAGVQQELSESIQWVDALGVLQEHKDEEIYYHTDHHWTSLAASYVFEGLRDVMQLDETYITPLKPYAVTNDFQGTLSAKSGYERRAKETIYAYLPEDGQDTGLVVYDVESGEKTASLYHTDKLNERDKYGVFLGGNSPLLDIQTVSDSQRKLLIFKDSYANCMIPFLVSSFRQIEVVDPRYYYGDVQTLIEENDITDVLFLYNGNTFFTDNSLSGVLKE